MVTELAEPFEMSLPAVSKHVKVLENAGLVARTIDGRIHRCSLIAEPLHDAERWLECYRSFWEGKRSTHWLNTSGAPRSSQSAEQ